MTDWVAPDSPASPPVAPPTAPPPLATTRPLVAGEDRHRPSLAPRNPTELADDAFGFLRRNPGPVMATVAAFVVPFALLAGYLQRNLLDGESFVDVFSSGDPSLLDPDAGSGGGASDGWLTFLSFVGPSIALVFVAGALTVMVIGERTGRRVTAGAALAAAGRRTPALLGAWVLVHLLELVGFVLIFIPGLLVMVAMVLVAPIVVAERAGPIHAMNRSWELIRRRYLAAMGLVGLTVVVHFMVENSLSVVPTFAAAIIGFDVGWIVLGAGTAAIQLITTTFVALTTVELYLDCRVRTEALDIELKIPELFPEPGH